MTSSALTYSRTARPKFRPSPGHLLRWSFLPLNLAGSPSGFPVLFGKFSGNGVGAPGFRIFNSIPHKTSLTASPSPTNSGAV